MGNGTAPNFDWPRDENGKPMALVSFAMSELVPTVQFGNATVGPASAMRFCEDTSDARKEGIRECVADVKEVLGKERNTVLEVLRQQRIRAAASS
jgi:hypothetical protein